MTKVWRMFTVVAVIWAAMLTTTVVQAQAQSDPQQQQQQQTAPDLPALQIPAVDRYRVGQARPPEVPGSPIVELTLEQAFQIALEKNIGIQTAKLSPVLQDISLRSLRAGLKPVFSSSYSYSNSRETAESVLAGVSRISSTSQSGNASIRQSFAWFGAPSINASFGSSRGASNDRSRRLNPTFNGTLNASLSMNLLNGFRIDSLRNNLRVAPIQRLVADMQLEQTIESTKLQVRDAYWSLRQAIEQIEIARIALEMAQVQLAQTRLRVEIGTMAPLETAQPEVTVAQQEQSLLQAEISWRNAELALKSLLVSGLDDELYRSTINPTDLPTAPTAPPTVDINAAMQTALAERSDLAISRRNLEVSQFGMEVTRNTLMPSLSFSTNYSVRGSGGPVLRDGVVVEPGGYLDALRQITGLETPNWSMQFQFSYPLGMAAAKANVARAEIQLEQERLRLRQQEMSVQTQVTSAGLQIENSYRQLASARKSREASEKNLEAVQTRFEVGLANNFEVVTAQRDLTSARLSELRAMITYMNALAEFERVQRFPR